MNNMINKKNIIGNNRKIVNVKKAEVDPVLSTWVSVVIGAVVIGIILFGFPLLSDAATHSKNFAKCKVSVAAATYSKNPVTGSSSVTTNCPRDSIIFYDKVVSEVDSEGNDIDKVVLDPDTGLTKTKFSELNDKIVFQIVSKKIKECWDKFDKGNGMPIDQNLFSSRKDNCHICTEISFSSKNQNFGSIEEYMKTYKFLHHTKPITEYFEGGLLFKTAGISSANNYKIVYLQNIPPRGVQFIDEDLAGKQKNQVLFGKESDINCVAYN